jgi:glycolate oxidase FAD binding subunit
MTPNDPDLQRLIDQVQAAQHAGAHLCIRGSGSKDFYGHAPEGERLDTTALTGISSYEPTELVVTARAGTPLTELEAALAEKGQHLPFEPPRFGGSSGGTVGGMIAAGLSGPSRAAVGAVRDYVLGATLLNGRAEVLSFGGQVIKNVAGYDVSRLLVGSLGTLGVILEASIKVLPVAPATATVRFDLDEAAALAQLHAWGGQPLPVSASALWNGTLVVRLSGAAAAVQSAAARFESTGGERIEPTLADAFWQGLRDHTDEFFASASDTVAAGGGLWRLSVPQTTPPLPLPGSPLIEWGGGLRWCVTPTVDAATVARMRELAAGAGGHATLFRSIDKSQGVFAPLAGATLRIHRELKRTFDPQGLFNPGRASPQW